MFVVIFRVILKTNFRPQLAKSGAMLCHMGCSVLLQYANAQLTICNGV
jgi:hypothetical protein